jgi:hypothetical protein
VVKSKLAGSKLPCNSIDVAEGEPASVVLGYLVSLLGGIMNAQTRLRFWKRKEKIVLKVSWFKTVFRECYGNSGTTFNDSRVAEARRICFRGLGLEMLESRDRGL